MDSIKEKYIEYKGSLYKLIEPELTHVKDIRLVDFEVGKKFKIDTTKSLYEQYSPCCYICKNNEIGYCIEKCKKLDLEESKNTCCTEYKTRGSNK